jgi:hypothetical protein
MSPLCRRIGGGVALLPQRFFSHLGLSALLWRFRRRHLAAPHRAASSLQRRVAPEPSTSQRHWSPAANPWPGLTHKPPGPRCKAAAAVVVALTPVRPAPAEGRPGAALVPVGPWGVSRRAGPPPRPRASPRRPGAPVAVPRVARGVVRAPRPDLPWHTDGGRAARARGGLPGPRAGASGHRAGLCGRSAPGAAGEMAAAEPLRAFAASCLWDLPGKPGAPRCVLRRGT